MAYTDRNPDAAILGKSPSSRMGYSSANHLLNFQYQSHQVCQHSANCIHPMTSNILYQTAWQASPHLTHFTERVTS